jgi:hypothetical protein
VKLSALSNYGDGEEVVVVVLDSVWLSLAGEGALIVVFDSVFVSFVVAGEGFTIVVLLSFFSPPAGGVTVVSFCSQATRRAAPARMHMYFFIILSSVGDYTTDLGKLQAIPSSWS